jgi:RimJ/RimL family protein N-acetyltransferase
VIYLREANMGDCSIVMSWHSNPLIYSGFYTIRSPLTWDEHLRWWTLTTKDWKKLIIMMSENDIHRPIGLVRIAPLEDFSPQISLTIGEVSLWGQGYGRQALRLVLSWLIRHGYKHTHTTILETNERAIRLFESLGFKKYGEARRREVWIQRSL